MSWQYDPSEPLVTPDLALEYACRRYGITREQAALPPALVATFQEQSYARLVEQTGAAPLETPVAQPGAAGGFLVGKTSLTGRPVAIRRFPFGAPGTAMHLEHAIVRGVREVFVCGAAGSLQPSLPLGSVVVVTAAEREDGTSHHYLPPGEPAEADPGLVALLVKAARELGAAPVLGRAWTIDAVYRETEGAIQRHRAAGVAVVEMEAAAMFAIARVRDVRLGLVVAISDELFDAWNPGFHLPAYEHALLRAADAALLAAEWMP